MTNDNTNDLTDDTDDDLPGAETRDQILTQFKEALYDDDAIIETRRESNNNPIHSYEHGVVGSEQDPVTHIEVASPSGLTAQITIEHGRQTLIWGDDEDEYEYEPPTIDVSSARGDPDGEHTCDGCGRPWDRKEWDADEDRSWGGRGGGEAYYQCPTDDCPGLAFVGW